MKGLRVRFSLQLDSEQTESAVLLRPAVPPVGV